LHDLAFIGGGTGWPGLLLVPRAAGPLALVLIEDEKWLALVLWAAGPLALVLIEDEKWLTLVLLLEPFEGTSCVEGMACRGTLKMTKGGALGGG